MARPLRGEPDAGHCRNSSADVRSDRLAPALEGSGPYLFALPATLLFAVFIAYPILWVAGQSLWTRIDVGRSGFAGLANYGACLADPTFWIVVRNMFLWGAITIPVQMLIGGLLAYFIERHTYRLRGFFRTMYFLPVVTSVSVISLVWVQIYAPYYGIAQEYLKHVGIVMVSSPIAEPRTAIYALILVNIWQWTGFSMLMYIAGLANMPSEVLDAARVDGATGWRLAVNVVVPMLAPATKSLLLLGIIGTLQTFPIVHLMTGGGPNHASEVFGTQIFKQSFVIGDTGGGATLSVIVLVIALALVARADRVSRRAARAGREGADDDAPSRARDCAAITIHAVLLVVLAFWMVPQIYMLSIGLRTPAQAFDPALITLPITFENFVTVIRDNPLGRIFLNSLVVTVGNGRDRRRGLVAFRFRLRDSAAQGIDLPLRHAADHADGAACLARPASGHPSAELRLGKHLLGSDFSLCGARRAVRDRHPEGLHGGLARRAVRRCARSTAATPGRSIGTWLFRSCGRPWCSSPSGSSS